MEGFLIRAAVVAVGLWLASKIGLVAFNTTGTLIAAALLLGVVNAFVRPIIIILTLPITLVTLGLFLLVINALMILLVAWFLPGFLVRDRRRDRRQPHKLGDVRLDRPARPCRDRDRAPAAPRALVSRARSCLKPGSPRRPRHR
jgi:putative membrane protein